MEKLLSFDQPEKDQNSDDTDPKQPEKVTNDEDDQNNLIDSQGS